MKRLGKSLLLLLPCTIMLSTTTLADPYKNESGHGRGPKVEHERGPHGEKYEWQSGNCKYERKSGPGGYKEEMKCDGGPPRFAGGPPPWAPAHGYRRDHYHEYGLEAPPINMDMGRCNREVIGQILGGATGGIVGAQIGDGTGRLIAVATGTVIGMIAGREIGRTMDRADELCVDQALEHAPDNRTVSWQHGGQQYSVTPQQTYENRNGQYCREYRMQTGMNGQTQQVSGTACRQSDGSWRIVGS